MALEEVRTHLHRCTETSWSYILPHREIGPPDAVDEIVINIPSFPRGRDAYSLITAVTSIFNAYQSRLTQSLFRKSFHLQITDPESPVIGTWQISAYKDHCVVRRLFDSVVDRALQFDPFTRQIKQEQKIVANVRRIPETYAETILHSIFGSIFFRPSTSSSIVSQSPPLPLIVDVAQRIHFHSFTDPFTHLAARCFKNLELFFTMEREHRGRYRFIVSDGATIQLVEDIVPADEEALGRYQEENRKAVHAYRDFFVGEYGECILRQTECSFGIDFDTMIKQGLPLYPDHVSKCNVGANNIEIYILERLWKRLLAMKEDLQGRVNDHVRWKQQQRQPASEYMAQLRSTIPFSIRALRGIFRSIPLERRARREPTIADLHAFLNDCIGDREEPSVRDLPPRTFNTLIDFVMPSDRERRKSLTGRRIRHVCIMGYHKMGEPNTPNPCRDLFELLHIFPDLTKEDDWKNFFELLSHVAVKKTLVRDTPGGEGEEKRHIGFLLPGPKSSSGESRWYCTDAYCNDGQGNVNYVLLPACTGYRSNEGRPLPLIKLYRSTASNRNAESWQDSLAADLNPHGAPGSLQPELSMKYEWPHFEERTIPLWMGYLIHARQLKLWWEKAFARDRREAEHFFKDYQRHILDAANACEKYLAEFHADTPRGSFQAALRREDLETLETLMILYGHQFREDPRYKIHQDCALIGHSLGGALAQAGTYMFSAKMGRLPMPGHQFICYSSDGPAIDNWKDAEFMAFGQEHRRLFEALHVQWKIVHQFEYGDFIPEAGGSHLGTTEYHQWKDKQWIKDTITVFRPLKTAKALSIVTAPTHGRRIGTAVLERDYTLTKISPLDLQEYDHSWWLRHRIGKIWGYRFFNSPRTSELVRKNFSRLIVLPLRLFNLCVRRQVKGQDAEGVSWQKNSRISPEPEFAII